MGVVEKFLVKATSVSDHFCNGEIKTVLQQLKRTYLLLTHHSPSSSVCVSVVMSPFAKLKLKLPPPPCSQYVDNVQPESQSLNKAVQTYRSKEHEALV